MADDDDKEDEKVEASLEGDEEEGEEGEEGEGKSSKKKLFIIIGVVVLLLAGGGGAYFMGILDPYIGGAETSEDGEHAEEDGHHEEGDDHGDDHGAKDDGHGDGHGDKDGHGGSGPYFLAMPDQRVNLDSEGGAPTYLQLSVKLELKSSSDMKKVEAVMPRVVDQFQTYLRELRVRDLKGSAGIYRLQAELLNRVNTAAAPIEVKDVLFQEILIQEN